MHVVYDIKNGDYIESESGERVQLYYPFDKKAIIKAWEFGLEEAWEAVKKITSLQDEGGLPAPVIKELFGFSNFYPEYIFEEYSAKEVIKRIKEYEEKKAEKDERIEYLKHEDIKKDGKTLRVWYGGNDSRCALREKKENVQFPVGISEEVNDRYKDRHSELMREAFSKTFERMNENKGEEEKEKEMKPGDKFIIELGEKTRIQNENSKGEWVATHECFRIDGTGSVISVEDLLNLEEYKENDDEKENVKHVSPEMLEKININPGKGMKKFQEEKAQRAGIGKDSAVGKKFLIEIEKEEEGCYFELKGTNERYFETVCKIKGTNAYIKKADLDKLEKREEKKKEEEIKVGDEIIGVCKEKAVVTHIIERETCKCYECIGEGGTFVLGINIEGWKKTGKHYDEVEKIFQKLKAKEPKFKVGDKVKYKTNGGWYNHGIIEELYEKRCLIKLTDKIDGIEYMSISYNDLVLDDRK